MNQEVVPVAERAILYRSAVNARRFAAQTPFATAWGVVALLLVLMAIAAPIIAPHDPIKSNFTKMQAPPDRQSLFGTDNIGRDISAE